MNVATIRKEFPILMRSPPPAYLDNACMTLKPRQVIAALTRYYEDYPFCAGRAVYEGAATVERKVEETRGAVARLINAASKDEIVFTRNTTEAINLVSRAFPFEKGQTIVTSDKEHNSNLVPWQLASRLRETRHVVVSSTPDGGFDLKRFEATLGRERPAMVSMAHTSNLDGTTIPAAEVVAAAHETGALVMLDAAQSVPHGPFDVRSLDVDLAAFSLHKMLGPTGVGVLYGKADVLARLDEFNVGGETVHDTTYATHEMKDAPARFEAGLQDYAGLIAAKEAVDYVGRVGPSNIAFHERELNAQMDGALREIPGVSVLGPVDPRERGGITSFNVAGLDPHEVAILLEDLSGVMVRSGDHCVHSWFNANKIPGSVRSSVYLYNDSGDVERLTDGAELIARKRSGASSKRGPG
ncbi:MAG: aminotransferase class V-fold PLP-dependent enzyme [Euryarchaeota archaeon]|nr:aminotransferase class V-fold PLP-dependent enzyme [Euryarchaeota archaeon]